MPTTVHTMTNQDMKTTTSRSKGTDLRTVSSTILPDLNLFNALSGCMVLRRRNVFTELDPVLAKSTTAAMTTTKSKMLVR